MNNYVWCSIPCKAFSIRVYLQCPLSVVSKEHSYHHNTDQSQYRQDNNNDDWQQF